MRKENIDIRSEIKKSGFFYWEVAQELNLSDGSFSRLLRKEMDISQKLKIKEAIKELEKRKRGD